MEVKRIAKSENFIGIVIALALNMMYFSDVSLERWITVSCVKWQNELGLEASSVPAQLIIVINK